MRQALAGCKIIFGFFVCHHIKSIIIFHRDLIKCHIHIFYRDFPVPYPLGFPAVFSSHGCQNGIHIEHLPVQPEHTLRIFIADYDLFDHIFLSIFIPPSLFIFMFDLVFP